MSKTIIQVYVCTDTRCRNVEEYEELSPKHRNCSKCGKMMRYGGQREIKAR